MGDGEQRDVIPTRLRQAVRPLPLLLVVLATIEPFAGFLARNRGEYLQIDILAQIVVASLVVSVAAFLAVAVLLRGVDPARLAAGHAALGFCFFRYGDVFRDSDHGLAIRLGAWVVLTAVAVVAVGVWSSYEGVRLFLVVFLAIATLIPAVSYAGYEFEQLDQGRPLAAGRAPIEVADHAVRTPDVWWLVLDGYARADALSSVHDFDNTEFVDALTDRGFQVSDDSYSSYPNTALSMSSILELDYVATTPESLGDGVEAITSSFRTGGRVASALREHGYRYLYADDGVYAISQCDPSAVDVCVEARPGRIRIGHLARTVADMTPLAELRQDVQPDPEAMVERILDDTSPDEPDFVFAHFLNPHEPMWYDDDCGFRSEPQHTNFGPDAYLRQLSCLNPSVIAAVDRITDADPEALVIIQSDHGTGFLGNWHNRNEGFEDWDADALAERYATLEAMRFPDACETPSGDHTIVGTFEFVLACIEGREPVPVIPRYFFWRKGGDDLVEFDQPRPSN